MSSTITQTTPAQGNGNTETRARMEKLFGQLNRKQAQKLPRLQPPERIKANVRGVDGVSYTVIDRHGEANILNHAEMTELHAIATEITKAANATSEQRAAIPTN